MSTKQTTIKKSISLQGVGIHTGNKVTLTFNPAVENTGYMFKRIDLPGQPEIEALSKYVIDTQRGTTLEKNGPVGGRSPIGAGQRAVHWLRAGIGPGDLSLHLFHSDTFALDRGRSTECRGYPSLSAVGSCIERHWAGRRVPIALC